MGGCNVSSSNLNQVWGNIDRPVVSLDLSKNLEGLENSELLISRLVDLRVPREFDRE